MNNEFKPLIWSGAIVMVILAVFLLVSTNTVWNTVTTTNTVSFSGEGKVSAKPDIAVVDFSITTSAATSKDAQNQNSSKSQKVTDFLKSQSIADKDVKTMGYNIYPQYSFRPCTGSEPGPCFIQKQVISGYQVSQSLEVKIRNLDKVSTILDGLVSAGANQVNNLGLQIDNPEVLKSQARQLAIADAKKKASELESQVGISLGKIVNFSENTGGYPVPMMFEAKGMGGGVSSGPSIPTGENEITVDVNITYQIK